MVNVSLTTPEHEPTHPTAMLPVELELRAVYEAEFEDMGCRGKVVEATNMTWWSKLRNKLKGYDYGVPAEKLDYLELAARHSLDFDYKGSPTGQGFTVFEMGEPEEDRDAVETVFRALEYVDQLSGGLLAAEGRKNIVLNNAFRMYAATDPRTGTRRESMGLTFDQTVVISIPYVKAWAEENPGTDFHNLLATLVVHEVLGHKTGQAVTGRAGGYFAKYFTYGNQGEGTFYPKIFRTITPKENIANTHPVREYGAVGTGFDDLGAEDEATSIDAMVADVMGWEQTNRHSPRLENKLDPYRDELALRLLGEAAMLARDRGYVGVPGHVGSELYYDEDGRPRSARTMHVTSSYAEDARRMEIRRIAEMYKIT